MSFKMRAVAVAAGLGLALAVAPGAALADDLASLTVTETPEVSVIAAQDATDGPEASVPAGEKDLPPRALLALLLRRRAPRRGDLARSRPKTDRSWPFVVPLLHQWNSKETRCQSP